MEIYIENQLKILKDASEGPIRDIDYPKETIKYLAWHRYIVQKCTAAEGTRQGFFIYETSEEGRKYLADYTLKIDALETARGAKKESKKSNIISIIALIVSGIAVMSTVVAELL